ncbi:MAG TPA: hypothetical protein PKM25_19180, partial [Candidatus Ozemobacteraceae bacterium]|nr:hypothetical protein [Candidatus Ozemobacteraceae bacterium]
AKQGPLDIAGHFILAYGLASEGNGAAAYRDLVLLSANASEQPGSRASVELQKLLQSASRLMRAGAGKS